MKKQIFFEFGGAVIKFDIIDKEEVFASKFSITIWDKDGKHFYSEDFVKSIPEINKLRNFFNSIELQENEN